MQGSTIQTLSEYIVQLHSNEQLKSQFEQPDFDTTIHASSELVENSNNPPEIEQANGTVLTNISFGNSCLPDTQTVSANHVWPIQQFICHDDSRPCHLFCTVNTNSLTS